jgi:sulfate/thiosulfate transport system permease protein
VSTPRDVREAKFSSLTRRRLVHGGLIAVALLYVGILVLAPLAGIAWAAIRPGWAVWRETLTSSDALHAYNLTLIITIVSIVVTATLGVAVALVLARDRFPGRGLVSAVADLPIAISPVIVGLMAVLLFGRGGWFEPWFTAHGIQMLFAVPSMAMVTLMICIPFVIREVAPILEELGTEEEQAAKTLGASSFQTFFRVTLPNIRWGLAYGIALSTARAIGEVGAVIVVSGLIAGQTETATLYIFRLFDQNHDDQGYVVALTLAFASIVLLAAIEFFKHREEKELSK